MHAHALMRFLCYGLLTVGCVLTYYSHRRKTCEHVSMLDPTARMVKCTVTKQGRI